MRFAKGKLLLWLMIAYLLVGVGLFSREAFEPTRGDIPPTKSSVARKSCRYVGISGRVMG